MSVSVVIPTFNRAATLPRALNSVLAQDYPVDQIIVVDDGSEDDTAALVQANYPQCTYLHQENKGVSAARNLGIKQVTSDWIAFLDSDDSWLPEKLSKQFECLAANPEARLCHSDEIWIRNGVRVNQMQKHEKTGGWIFERCLPMCVISPSAAVIHRSLLNDIGLFDESLPACEDYDLWLRICLREAVACVETPLLMKYGGHEDQLSRHYWGMDRFRIEALENLLRFYGNTMTETQYLNVADTIATKADILAKGAAKRGNTERARFYQEKVDHFGHQ